VNEEAAKRIIVGLHTLALTLIRPANGTMNVSTAASIVVVLHTPERRSVKKCVSSARLPYQMMMNCEKVR
jgi:hypothetical protein